MNGNPAPAVSVILPAFNAERFVGEAVASVLAQSFADFELIVVDDGSTDRTLEIVRANTDRRVRVIANGKNLGIPKTRNVGIKNARGRYVAWQDADDTCLPTRLQKQFEFMESHTDVAVVGTGRQTMLPNGKIKTHKPRLPSPTFDDMLKRNCMISASAMMRKKCLDETGGYDDFFRQAEDYDLQLRLTKKYSVTNLQEALYVVRRNTDSLSRSNPAESALYHLLARNRATDEVGDAAFARVKKNGIESYYNELSEKDKAFFHLYVGKKYMRYARNGEALKHFRELRRLRGANFKIGVKVLLLRWRLAFGEGV